MPLTTESQIVKTIALLYQQLGFSQHPINLEGYVEVLRPHGWPAVHAACAVALHRAWSRPPQPGDLLQIIEDAGRYAIALHAAPQS
ncbi:MAG TPA: hypothetical protein VNP04_15500 [Alphaproteobacteria bacterium]|nr:hypothetical protein [Alphaproteobacteria bacterium]